MRVLITGAAGFIGSFTTHRLLDQGETVIGLDNLNDYYDPTLKDARIARIQDRSDANRFEFIKADITDSGAMAHIFESGKFDRVVHLAAQAGVRYSIENPHAYASANLTGFLNILEGCRHNNIEHLVYASTSSVYGSDTSMPFSEHVGADHPLTFYAATKRANELMAHSYSNLFNLPCTGLRFFTVYGPWGRPDMALFIFAKAILEGRPIDVFNHGKMTRDFTFVDDIVEGVIRVLDKPATPSPSFDPIDPDPSTSSAPYRIFNIGNSQPTPLMDYIGALESELGSSDTSALEDWVGFRPRTTIREGVGRFVAWYREYYQR